MQHDEATFRDPFNCWVITLYLMPSDLCKLARATDMESGVSPEAVLCLHADQFTFLMFTASANGHDHSRGYTKTAT